MEFSNICVAQCQGFNLGVTQLNLWAGPSLEVRCPVGKVVGFAGRDGSSPAACLSSLTASPWDG